MSSMLFSDVSLNFDGENLISYGNESDICVLERKEVIKGKSVDERDRALKNIQGKLEGIPVIKFYHSGSIVCLSFESLHKILEESPEALKQSLKRAEEFKERLEESDAKEESK